MIALYSFNWPQLLLSSWILTAFFSYFCSPYKALFFAIFLGLIGVGISAFFIINPYFDFSSLQAFESFVYSKNIFLHDELAFGFSLLITWLGLMSYIYTFYFFKIARLPRRRLFFLFYCLSIACALFIAHSGSLIALFSFYELLTVMTVGLLFIHVPIEDAKVAAKKYASVLICMSLLLFLPCIIALAASFGHVHERAPLFISCVFVICLSYGVAKAGLMPLSHFWLGASMVALPSVSGLFHAVAVVKSGLFVILRILLYAEDTIAPESLDMLFYIGGLSSVCAAYFADKQDKIKSILAYSTLSQLGYMSMMISRIYVAQEDVMKAVFLYAFAHACAKISAFYSSGLIKLYSEVDTVSQMQGFGAKYPCSSFLLAFSLISLVAFPISFIFVAKVQFVHVVSSSVFFSFVSLLGIFFTARYVVKVVYSIYNSFQFSDVTFQSESLNVLIPIFLILLSSIVAPLMGCFL